MENIEEPCVGGNRNRTWYMFTIQPSHKLIRTTLKIESHSRGEPTQTTWYLRTQTRKHLNEVCDPTGTRTPNLQLRRLLLYPVELSDQLFILMTAVHREQHLRQALILLVIPLAVFFA